MAPALHHGDVVLVLVVPGIERWVEPGDVVLARVPGESGEGLVIKRVVAETGSPHAPRFELRGDDPQRSRDSRHYGPIGTDRLAGRVLWRLYPWPPGPPGRSGAADSREPAAR
ncbi:MAG: S26 family signal peptidase [Acidobacteriota bacterium]|nr:MAG: S26 family signal peptidase [Acidobacteriota bacterium]